MSKPILYYATLSPPSRTVLLTAKEIGLELDLRPISLFKNEHLTHDFVKKNPQHTIPVLEDNGVFIFDSHAICSYLVDKYAKDDKLYPKDLVRRAAVQSRMYFETSYLFGRLHLLYEPIIFFGSPELPEATLESIREALDIMEAFLEGGPYVSGNDLTLADFCCVTTISSMEEPAIPTQARHPKVMTWMKRMATLPYYKVANYFGAEELKQLYRENLAKNRTNI